jgi:hypothetical protein
LSTLLSGLNVVETWIQLKRPLVQSKDYGDTLSAVQIFDVRAKVCALCCTVLYCTLCGRTSLGH